MSENNLTQLSQGERADVLVSLANFRQERKRERTTYEWRLTLALWAFMVGVTFYIRPRPNDVVLAAILVLVFLMHVFFILEIRLRSRMDSEMAFFYVGNAERLLKMATDEPCVRPTYKR